MNPGIYYDLPMEEYLALPALSAGVLRTLIDRCPLAAFSESPYNANRIPDTSDDADAGTIAHSIVLEGGAGKVEVIDPKQHPTEKTGNIPTGWTNKSIRAARDAARAAGKIPVLAPAMDEIGSIASATIAYIAGLRELEPAVWAAFQSTGHSEVTFIWEEDGILCKARADRIAADFGVVIDLKFTGRSAEPDSYARSVVIGDGAYVGAAFYRRGIRKLTGVKSDYLYLVTETVPPFLSSLVGMNPETLALGDEKVAYGIAEWSRCWCERRFPAYPSRAVYPEMSQWETARWQERQATGDWRALFPDLAEKVGQ